MLFQRKHIRIVSLAMMFALFALVGGIGQTPAVAEKPQLIVGGKNFTEQHIMAHMVAAMLEEAGYPVEVKSGLGSGDVIFSALERGDIHMYVEYSGTAWAGFLNEEVEVGMDPDWLFEATAKGMKEQFGLDVLDNIGFSNTYVFVVTKELAEQHNLRTVSDLIPIAKDLTLGGTIAFMGDRPDGIRGAESVYGFKFRRNRSMDHALLFQALQLKQVDAIVAFSTDGQIAAMDLVMLEDDLGVFPPYHAGVMIREEILEANPDIREVLGQLAGLIDEHQMATLNFEVDDKRRDDAEVAREFLREQGLIQ